MTLRVANRPPRQQGLSVGLQRIAALLDRAGDLRKYSSWSAEFDAAAKWVSELVIESGKLTHPKRKPVPDLVKAMAAIMSSDKDASVAAAGWAIGVMGRASLGSESEADNESVR